jgi:hypothetical protein
MRATSKVELDIFSGRPNPVWTLIESERDSLAERLASLPPARPRTLSANLGYRGLIVTVPGQDGVAINRVQRGTVETTVGARTTYRDDPGRAFERWLLDTGTAHIAADIREVLRREFK